MAVSPLWAGEWPCGAWSGRMCSEHLPVLPLLGTNQTSGETGGTAGVLQATRPRPGPVGDWGLMSVGQHLYLQAGEVWGGQAATTVLL